MIDNKEEIKQIKCMVLEIRKNQSRLGGRKLLHKLKDKFKAAGIQIGRDKFFAILAQEFLLVRPLRSAVRTTRRAKRFNLYPNLIRKLEITKPEQVWVSDVTYVHHKHGTSYLHLTTDAYSKKIVGYKLSDNIKSYTTTNVIKKAVKNRRYPKRKLIHHSDRGFNYTADEFRNYLLSQDIKISNTTKYDPYENAVAERINGILKQEFNISDRRIPRDELDAIVHHAIYTYNNERPHLSCEYLTPNEAHTKGKYKLKKWSKMKRKIN